MTEEKKPYFQDSFGNIHGNLLVSPTGRAQWCYLDKKNTFGKEPKYSITLLFDPADPADATVAAGLEAISNHYDELLAQKYAGQNIPPLKNPLFRDGDDPKLSKFQGFTGMIVITSKNAMQPVCFNQEKQAIDPATILPGMKVRIVFKLMSCTDGPAFKLERVQLVKDDGVRFHAGANPDSLLDAISDDGTASEATQEAPVEASPIEVQTTKQETRVIQTVSGQKVVPVVTATGVQATAQSAAQKKLQEQLAKAKVAPKVIGAAGAAAKKGIGAALNRL